MTEGGNNGIRREAHRPRREQQLEREPRTCSSPTCSPSLSSLRNLEYEQRHQRQQRQASASLLLPQRATAFTSTGTTTRIRARKKMIATPSSPSSPPLSSSSPPLSSSSPSLLRQQKKLLQIQRQWDERATEKRIASRGGCPELVQSGRRREQQYSNLFVQEFQEGEYDYACDEGEGGRVRGRERTHPFSSPASSTNTTRYSTQAPPRRELTSSPPPPPPPPPPGARAGNSFMSNVRGPPPAAVFGGCPPCEGGARACKLELRPFIVVPP